MKMIRKKPDENEKRTKEYDARGERIYKNAINRENAKNKNAKHKQTNEEAEEDERIIQIVSKLGGLEEDKK